MNRLAEGKGHQENRFRNVVVSFVAAASGTANGGRLRYTDPHADKNGNRRALTDFLALSYDNYDLDSVVGCRERRTTTDPKKNFNRNAK